MRQLVRNSEIPSFVLLFCCAISILSVCGKSAASCSPAGVPFLRYSNIPSRELSLSLQRHLNTHIISRRVVCGVLLSQQGHRQLSVGESGMLSENPQDRSPMPFGIFESLLKFIPFYFSLLLHLLTQTTGVLRFHSTFFRLFEPLTIYFLIEKMNILLTYINSMFVI